MKYDIESMQNRHNTYSKIKKVVHYLLFISIVIIIYNLILIITSDTQYEDSKGLFGYNAFAITTSSMSPNINEGDVIIITKCKKDDLKKGEIITFKSNVTGDVVTHRITDITKEGKFITKGDNNNVTDEEVLEFDQVKGRFVLKIPVVGKAIVILKSKVFILIMIVSVIILSYFFNKKQAKIEARRMKKKNEDKKYNNQTTESNN